MFGSAVRISPNISQYFPAWAWVLQRVGPHIAESTFKVSALSTDSNSYIDDSDARFIWEIEESAGILRDIDAGEFLLPNLQRPIEPNISSRLVGSMYGP